MSLYADVLNSPKPTELKDQKIGLNNYEKVAIEQSYLAKVSHW